LWQSTLPSRFIDELPKDHVEVSQSAAGAAGSLAYAPSRFAQDFSQGSSYTSPGWRRAQEHMRNAGVKTAPIIDVTGELTATSDPSATRYKSGERVFHQKFGYGHVTQVDGNKLTVEFDKAGQKKVIDSFLERA
jgi:DNA helicase-2/ATP-dependent DNA helicase PcrA